MTQPIEHTEPLATRTAVGRLATFAEGSDASELRSRSVQRVAHLYSRLDALIDAVKGLGQAADPDMGATYLALHTLRCRVATQHRVAGDARSGAETSIDDALRADAERRLYDTARDLIPGVIELDDDAWRAEYLHVQRNVVGHRLLDLADVTVAAASSPLLDTPSLASLEVGLRATMTSICGAELDAALAQLGWATLLADTPQHAIALVFRLLGETGSHASVLNDVVQQTADREVGATPALPYAGGGWVVWDSERSDDATALGGLPLRRVDEGGLLRLADARRALGWWLIGSSRAMLALARQHAVDDGQPGRPDESIHAVRHRLTETLVAIDGAEATLLLPGVDNPDLTALLAKAAAGKAALTAAKHCQQVLGGIGLGGEPELHRHVERVLVLDGLLGSSRELTKKAGAGLRARGSAPRLAHL